MRKTKDQQIEELQQRIQTQIHLLDEIRKNEHTLRENNRFLQDKLTSKTNEAAWLRNTIDTLIRAISP